VKRLSLVWVACLFAGCVTVIPMYMYPPPEEAGGLPSDLEGLEGGHAGFLLGSPVGITSNNSPTVTIKLAGFTPLPDGDATDPPVAPPQFEKFHEDVFRGIPESFPVRKEPILAMSLGLDVIVVDTSHSLIAGDTLDEVKLEEADVPQGGIPVAIVQTPGDLGWIAFEFSVNSIEVRGGAMSLAVAEAGEERDRTVFSYLIPGAMPTLEVEYESVSAMGPETLGLGVGDEIHGLNMHMALYDTDLTVHANRFTARPDPTPRNAWVYFTLRPAFWSALDATQRGTLAWVGADPTGTIYRAQWDPAAPTPHWNTPVLYRTALQLLGVRQPPNLDGLAIDASADGAAKILFSTDDQTGAADQIRFVEVPARGAPGRPPRRVVIGRGSRAYGSLGVQLGAGSGIGDFCTKDPALRDQKYGSDHKAFPDEFFIARRIAPPAPYVEPIHPGPAIRWPHLPLPERRFYLDPERDWTEPPIPRWTRQFVPRWPTVVQPQAYLFRRHPPFVWPVPELALAVSGYRQYLRNSDGVGVAQMRTCMSWPRPIATSGTATVEWGVMENIAHPNNINWEYFPAAERVKDITYDGRPLVATKPLPVAVPGEAPQETVPRAMVARWSLQAGGKSYISHISALRY